MDADEQAETNGLLEKLVKSFASDAVFDGQIKTLDNLETEANEIGNQLSSL